jgi:hypothetical protein
VTVYGPVVNDVVEPFVGEVVTTVGAVLSGEVAVLNWEVNSEASGWPNALFAPVVTVTV